jgi:cytochrome P450
MPVCTQPPGPRNPLVFGHLQRFRKDPLAFLQRLASRYGDAVYFRLGHQEVYFFNHPDLIREVLVNQQASFRKSRILQKAKIVLGEGLLTSEGEFHLRQRRLVQPAFHRERLIGYGEAMVELAGQAMRRWTAGEVMNIHEEMTRLTLAVVARTLFSANVEDEAEAIGEAMTAVLELFNLALLPYSELLVKLPIPASRRFRKARAQLDGTIYRIIEERRRSGVDKGDLLSMLILAQDEEQGTGGMTDQQVRDEAMTLFLAGHETTANALTWAWYLLSSNKEAEARLHAEIDRVLGSRAPSSSDVPALSYTASVFAESMRLFPPAWSIGRMVAREVRIGGYVLPPGAIVLVSPYVMHRDARFWSEPERFLPERFENGAERPKFAYFPFGGGSRICIGERFAWMEGTLMLAAIARRWRLRCVDQRPAVPRAQITLRPAGGIRMRLDSRAV